MKSIELIQKHGELKRGNLSSLAETLGLSSPMVLSQWIKRGSVPKKHIKALAKALNVKVEQLL